jgi:hypothetical protein
MSFYKSVYYVFLYSIISARRLPQIYTPSPLDRYGSKILIRPILSIKPVLKHYPGLRLTRY